MRPRPAHEVLLLAARGLVGHPIQVSSPNGRANEISVALSDSVLSSVECHGKHVFLVWEAGVVLHLHLGLFGRVRTSGQGKSDSPSMLRLATAASFIEVSGAGTCALVRKDDLPDILGKIGQDLGQQSTNVEDVILSLRVRRQAIGSLLLDQAVLAGVDNSLRCEALFAARIAPTARCAGLPDRAIRELVTFIRMEASRVRDGSLGASGQSEPSVYGRAGQHCFRCGALVTRIWQSGRATFACFGCQTIGAAESEADSSTPARKRGVRDVP